MYSDDSLASTLINSISEQIELLFSQIDKKVKLQNNSKVS